MPTIPDDHQPGYGNGPALAALRSQYPAPWVIRYEAPLHIYSAELRSADGRSLHYLCGHDVGELAARLVTATALDADS
jgi:hypothetical protein